MDKTEVKLTKAESTLLVALLKEQKELVERMEESFNELASLLASKHRLPSECAFEQRGQEFFLVKAAPKTPTPTTPDPSEPPDPL